MTYALTILAAVLVTTVSAAAQSNPATNGTRSFYDRNGSFSGSSTTYNSGRNESFYDKNGRFDGSAIRNSDGTTSLYDRNGRFTGSSTNTTQPR